MSRELWPTRLRRNARLFIDAAASDPHPDQPLPQPRCSFPLDLRPLHQSRARWRALVSVLLVWEGAARNIVLPALRTFFSALIRGDYRFPFLIIVLGASFSLATLRLAH